MSFVAEAGVFRDRHSSRRRDRFAWALPIGCRLAGGDSGYDDRKAMHYLLKTEPTIYSFADLERDKETIWDGVTNPTAVKHLREMKAGEKLIIYHTGDEKSAMGTATVVSVDAKDPKVPLVKIKLGKAVKTPKTLAEIKENKLFADSALVRIGRLSVVPLTEEQYGWLVG